MTISYFGQSCFKITTQGNRVNIIIDPFDKETGLSVPRASADIVMVSHDHHDHNNVGAIGGDPFVINSPGEYETKGISVVGVASFHDNVKGKEKGLNTIYKMNIDDIYLCHLGDLGEEELSSKELEAIGQVDVLMIPVGGTYTLDAKSAAKVVHQLEPSLVIPMHYRLAGSKANSDLAGIEEFLAKMGAEGQAAVHKLTVKKKDLKEKEMKVVVMKL